jgi:tetratricopeptide (TPR) repeat protein
LSYARDGRWADAERSFRHAIELDPNRSRTREDFSIWFLRVLGRYEEAIRQLRMARQADPLSPGIDLSLGDVLILAGRNEEAAEQCLKLTENTSRAQCLGRARLFQGRTAEAIELLSQIRGNPGFVGYAYGRAGRREDAERVLAEVTSNRPNQQALIFAGLGDKDRAMEALERMAVLGPQRLGIYLNYPELAFLRGDPRVKALRQRVGLPQ